MNLKMLLGRSAFRWLAGGMIAFTTSGVSVPASAEDALTTGAATMSKIDASSNSVLHRPLAESLTSFGAAVVGEYLYVFSGHSGAAHGFGKDLLVDHFRRIKFDDAQAEWEELAMHQAAQSVALVTDGKFIYRVGGLSFLDPEEEGGRADFNSTNHFARYDIDADEWTELASLPVPRSSLDAAVVGRSVYIAGGWNLQGPSSSDAPWHDNVLRFDLDDPTSGWHSIDGPGYLTRAASTAAHNGKLYLFGGIQKRGEMTRKVSVYDPAAGDWSEAPELPADHGVAGFATSSFACGGKLFVTGASGVVYQLSEDEKSWVAAQRLLIPRMFLRLLPASENRLVALGGTGSLGRTAAVESLRIDLEENAANQARWSVDFGGRAKHSQGLAISGGKLYAFGGNGSRKPHDFSESAFVNEAFAFDIGGQTVEQLPDLPLAMQSGSAVVHAQTSKHREILISGGLGSTDGELVYLDSTLSFDVEDKVWDTERPKLPAGRSMFQAVRHDEAIWMFGGSEGREAGLSQSVLHWWADQSAIAPLKDVVVPTPRRSFGGATLDGKYYMVGGLVDGNAIADSVDVFDFESRQWSTIASPKVARVFPDLVRANGKLYLFGGFENSSGHFSPAPSLEVYDPAEDAWTMVAESLSGVPTSMTLLTVGDRLMFYGVDPEVDGRANFVLYDPEPMSTPETVTGGFGGQGDDESAETARSLIRNDLDKDGKLSADELGSRLASLVADGDQDGDGLLTIAETEAVLKQRAEDEAAAEKAIEAESESAGDESSEKASKDSDSGTDDKSDKAEPGE